MSQTSPIRLSDYSLVGKDTALTIEQGLAEATWYTSPVPREKLRELLERRDGPAIRDTLNLVSTLDLAPTLLELAGMPVPAYMAGRSFVPLLNGEMQPNRDFVVGYYYNNLRQTKMYPEFTIQTRDWVYIYNPWVDDKTGVHNSDYTGSPTLLAMWQAAETLPAVRARVDFHKHRVMEELYDVRQDPYAYVNVAASPENLARVITMRQRLLAWMQETKHPAAKLMADPFNQTLIAEYMAWEKANAIKQIEEVERLIKEHRGHPQASEKLALKK